MSDLQYIGNYTREPSQRTRVYGINGISPTLVADNKGGGREPKIWVSHAEGDDMVSDVKFVGGIDEKQMWIADGKQLSRNYRQGDRVYDAGGVATTLTAQPIGGTGGATSLYLLDETQDSNSIPQIQLNIETKPFTYASAFAGIGGMSLGLEPLGGVGVAAWEYDPTEKRTQYAQEAHKLLHPNIPIYGDICEANPKGLPDFDLFCFTPPCQAFSLAGKKGGFEDTRGTLTFEALRIANVKRPKMLFMENVKGLVNHDNGNTFGTILHAINEIGYTVDFTVLNSKFFDVAQNRDRVYLIGVRDDLSTHEPWTDIKGSNMIPKAKRRLQEEGVRSFNFDWPPQTEVRTRLLDFLEECVDERYYLSEDKVRKLIANLDSIKDSEINAIQKNYRIRRLTPREALRIQSVPESVIDSLIERYSPSRIYRFSGNGLTINVIKAIGEKLLKYL